MQESRDYIYLFILLENAHLSLRHNTSVRRYESVAFCALGMKVRSRFAPRCPECRALVM